MGPFIYLEYDFLALKFVGAKTSFDINQSIVVGLDYIKDLPTVASHERVITIMVSRFWSNEPLTECCTVVGATVGRYYIHAFTQPHQTQVPSRFRAVRFATPSFPSEPQEPPTVLQRDIRGRYSGVSGLVKAGFRAGSPLHVPLFPSPSERPLPPTASRR